MKLSNAKAIVTGGGSGYGKGIAAALVAAGAKVWITGRDAAKLEAAAKETGATPFVADVSSPADWDWLLAAVGKDLDILVNNAGAGGPIKPVAEQRDEDIVTTIATNLTGVIFGCSRAGRLMAARRSGAIINVSSVCALYAWPGWSVYTAAKAGLAKFSHGLYTELRPHGVRVTCLTPSWGGPTSTAPPASAAPPRTRTSRTNAPIRPTSAASSCRSSRPLTTSPSPTSPSSRWCRGSSRCNGARRYIGK